VTIESTFARFKELTAENPGRNAATARFSRNRQPG